MQLVARMNHTRNEIKCGDFCVCFFKQRIINRQERYLFRATSCTLRCTNDSTTVRDSRFPRSVQLVARMIQPRYAIHRFPRSVQLVARMNHARYEIKCGDFCVTFFKQRIINRQERYSFRM